MLSTYFVGIGLYWNLAGMLRDSEEEHLRGANATDGVVSTVMTVMMDAAIVYLLDILIY